jgi:hypothetical protein
MLPRRGPLPPTPIAGAAVPERARCGVRRSGSGTRLRREPGSAAGTEPLESLPDPLSILDDGDHDALQLTLV